VAAVAGCVPVFLDGGIRRGTDVLKALALGAAAAGIGKPVFFALAMGGQAAVSQMLQLLQTELEAAMAICGVETRSDITSTNK
jgi:isopentenyl diphosphate isomerase/L-lactate dehydrogenase-like FMN-dependent dehydrogenase